jgi:arylsulfatase A-like enzyme
VAKFKTLIILIIAALVLFINLSRENSFDIKPNVILIMIDALRPDHLSCYGYSRNTSPNIDRLADSGVIFTQAFTQAPATTPSVASLFTSLYPRQHQAWSMHGEDGLKGTDQSLLTLPEIMKKNGYRTIGVVSNGHLDEQFGFSQGFNEYYETWKLTKASNFLADANNATEIIIPWLKKNRKNSFFMFLFYIDPHDPYSPPSPFDTKYQASFDRNLKGKENAEYLTEVILGDKSLSKEDIDYLTALYDGEVAYVDYHIGKLLDALEKYGIMKNTIIILTADHGEEFYEHGGALHGYALYNEHLRVPLIISSSKLNWANSRVQSVVRLIDIMPTISDLLGIGQVDNVEGESLLPLMELGYSDKEDRLVFAETRINRASGLFASFISLQKEDWKMIFNVLENKRELYDLKSDPYEIKNLIEKRPDKARKLSKDMLKFINLSPKVEVGNGERLDKVDQSTIANLKSLGYLQ